jgi:hypothetical protein
MQQSMTNPAPVEGRWPSPLSLLASRFMPPAITPLGDAALVLPARRAAELVELIQSRCSRRGVWATASRRQISHAAAYLPIVIDVHPMLTRDGVKDRNLAEGGTLSVGQHCSMRRRAMPRRKAGTLGTTADKAGDLFAKTVSAPLDMAAAALWCCRRHGEDSNGRERQAANL